MKRTYSHIELGERHKIARCRMAGLSIEIIAQKVGRHRSTIFREIKRNMFVDKIVRNLSGYYCVTAHDMGCGREAVASATKFTWRTRLARRVTSVPRSRRSIGYPLLTLDRRTAPIPSEQGASR